MSSRRSDRTIAYKKIFVGGLAKDTSIGEITGYVILKDKVTNHSRGFGFFTCADPSLVNKVINGTHVINEKQVEIKRITPEDASSRDFKTKKIFVGDLASTYTEDELRDFSMYGKVVDHQIIVGHSSNRSRGFGFIMFESRPGWHPGSQKTIILFWLHTFLFYLLTEYFFTGKQIFRSPYLPKSRFSVGFTHTLLLF
ncbi:unnamed protein product [Spirodela intermedia]|uniref:RRM domain-containing protein n=1 Tax=Spirodela intermedia TaxID=51605 RepID=A0A7I8JIW5_SPIIN|nr:unnamed protein product [Spirodela intermedia]CAA6670108.1 unnamed protein product [Spirodela intermedia]